MRKIAFLLAFGSLCAAAAAGCSLITSLDDLQTTDGGKAPGVDASILPDTSVLPDTAPAPDGPCVTESDPNFCKRLGKSCEAVTDNDNCGVSRSVSSCGVCSDAGAPACVSNVCAQPLCTGDYSGLGAPIPALNANGSQAALFGVSGNGGSILFLRAAANSCLVNSTPLYIADALTVNLPTVPSYTVTSIGALPNLQPMLRQQQSMALTSDGLTIIGVSTSRQSFLESKRSAVGAIDFAMAAAGAYNTVNAGIPAGAQLSLPAISGDGLSFYYSVTNATNPNSIGVYEATRPNTGVPFNAGVFMPAVIQTFSGVSGVSADRMTLFVTKFNNGFIPTILSRNSLSQPYAMSPILPPTSAARIVPIATCGFLFGSTQPGGCNGEQIAFWTKH